MTDPLAELALIVETVDEEVKKRIAPLLKELEETQKELNRLKIDHDRLVNEHRELREKHYGSGLHQ